MPADGLQGTPFRRVPAVMLPLVSWALGMALTFGTEIASGLRKMFANPRDARLVNYSLEHGYLWLLDSPLHRDFWQLPLFYPAANVTTFTDVLIGLGPLYWLLRALGAEPDTSLQLWVMICWSLNFAAAYLLLRRGVGVGVAPGTLGALLITFGSRQLAQIHHPQLIPLFLILFAAYSLYEILREDPNECSRWRVRAFIAALGACFTIQFWTAFYPFFFFGFLLVLALFWSLAFADTRTRLFAVLRVHGVFAIAAIGIAGALVAPLGLQYLETMDQIGIRPLNADHVSRPASWFLTGRTSFLHGWLQRSGPFSEFEHGIHGEGFGFLTAGLAFAGLALARARADARLLLLATGTTMLAATMFGEFTLWTFVREWIPGAQAIRSVARISMILILAVPIGAALLMQRWIKAGRILLAAGVAVACLAEQPRGLPGHINKQRRRNQIEKLAAKVGAECDAFFLFHLDDEAKPRRNRVFPDDDAAWVQLATGKPTVNGRYGNFPRGWGFFRTRKEISERPHAKMRMQIERWMRRHRAGGERVCMIDYE